MLNNFNCVRLCVTLWTVAHQAPLSMGSPGKNTTVGFHIFFQGIFLTQGSNPCLLSLLHWQADFFTTRATREAPFNIIAII